MSTVYLSCCTRLAQKVLRKVFRPRVRVITHAGGGSSVPAELKTEPSTVYGPVASWRVGRSLGVDVLCVNSVCSFRCVYCQLGRINVHTAERRVYVPTERVLEDLRAADWRGADVITLSGSGEPTLAANLGEVIRGIKRLTGKPVLVLTNSAHLWDAHVRRELSRADSVFCKLDGRTRRRSGASTGPPRASRCAPSSRVSAA